MFNNKQILCTILSPSRHLHLLINSSSPIFDKIFFNLIFLIKALFINIFGELHKYLTF